MKVCCGFGHRNVFQNISKKLYNEIEEVIQQDCEIFYTGAMGEFDSLFSFAVHEAKKYHPRIKLICVKPYFTNDINTNRDFYNAIYDDVIIPPEIIGVHYKSAIKAHNNWMTDNSDVVLVYTIRNYGGAYDAYRYAKKIAKEIISI